MHEKDFKLLITILSEKLDFYVLGPDAFFLLRIKFPNESMKLITLLKSWAASTNYVNNHGILYLRILEKLVNKYNY